jgi:hypothetical protein
MKKQLSKTKTFVIALILMLTFSALVATLPFVSASDPPRQVDTWTYIAVRNNPIGVNQDLLIIFWLNAVPPTASGAYGDRWTFYVDVTKPDGSKQSLGPITSDPIGGGWTIYTPSEVGAYTVEARFVEHKVTGLPLNPVGAQNLAAVNDTYKASVSNPLSVTVQADPIEAWAETPLPEEYWTRPINDANRDWYVLAGNWLAGAAQNVGPTNTFGYGPAPETAHVMWSHQMWTGGIMDERFGNTGYQTYHYEGLNFYPPIIIDGKLFYNVESIPRMGWYCVDLYTGETLYFHNTTGDVQGLYRGHYLSGRILDGLLSFGQIYNYESPNQHGGFPYLWSAGNLEPGPNNLPTPDWLMFDAFTGNWICTIAGAGTIPGTMVYGKDGSILKYRIAGGRLTCWNTSRAIWYKDPFPSNTYWSWRPALNVTYDAINGYSLNVSIPNVQGNLRVVREGEFVIGGTGGSNDGTTIVQGNLWALSLEPGKEGTLLWNRTFTPPVGGALGTIDPEDDVFLFEDRLELVRWAYDLNTGQPLWGPSEPEVDLNYYSMTDNIYDGKLLAFGYGGVLLAYDIRTGEILWTYTAQNYGFESPYGNYPLGIGAIADGKIYLGSGEHSPTQPLWRGSTLICVNASNGAELWKIQQLGVSMPMGNGGSNFAVADGNLLALSAYDNKIYCFGKGPSATAVTASPKVSALGSGIMIEGTVIDKSAGTTQQEQAGRFPNGVPAMSDESMNDWMEYVYMQQGCPADAKGVTVKLTAIDPNGNFQDIGEALTDINGNFGKIWQPPVPGEYHITATFEGSGSYWSSRATTYFGVSEAPSAAQPIEPDPTTPQPTTPTPTEPTSTQSELTIPEPTEPEPTTPEPTTSEPTEPTTETPLITTEIAIIAAIAVACAIGIVSFWALRKRE